MYQLISTLPHTSVLTNTHGVVNWWSHTTITHTLPDTAMETSRHTHHTTSTSVCWCGPRETRWSTTSWVMYSKNNTISDGHQMAWANSKYLRPLLQFFASDQYVLIYDLSRIRDKFSHFCLNMSCTCVIMLLFLKLSTETYDLDIFLTAIIMLPQNGFYWKKKKEEERWWWTKMRGWQFLKHQL